MKIIVVFGPSGSGKTFYIEKEIIKGLFLDETKFDGVDVSVNKGEKLLLFGKYNTPDRCKGCDKLSMAIIDPLIASLYAIIEEQKYETVVADGDRVNNDKMFQFLSQYKKIVEIVFIDTPLDLIFKRLPNCNKQFVKTTFTKTKHTIGKCLAMGLNVRHIKTARTPFFAKG